MGACPHPARGGHSGVATKLALPWLRAKRETCHDLPTSTSRPMLDSLVAVADVPRDGSTTAQLGRDSSAACRVALDRPVLWHRRHRAVRPLRLIRQPLAFRRAGERSGSRGARPQVTYRRLPILGCMCRCCMPPPPPTSLPLLSRLGVPTPEPLTGGTRPDGCWPRRARLRPTC